MAIEDDIKFLEGVPLLRLVGRAGLRIVAIGSETRYVHGGEVLFRKGEPAVGGFVVREGSFTLSAGEKEGAGDVVMGPRTLLGELALIAETSHGATATAFGPATVYSVPRQLFTTMLEGYPDAARRIRDHIAARTDQSMKDLLALHNRLKGRMT